MFLYSLIQAISGRAKIFQVNIVQWNFVTQELGHIYIYIASKEGREGENKLTEVAYCVCVFLCVLIGFVSLLLYLLIFSATFCMRLRCCKKTSVYRASVNWFLFPVRDVSWQNGHFCVGASCAQFAFLSFFPLAFWFITHFWYRAISFFCVVALCGSVLECRTKAKQSLIWTKGQVYVCVCVRLSKCVPSGYWLCGCGGIVREKNTNYVHLNVLRPRITINVLILCSYIYKAGVSYKVGVWHLSSSLFYCYAYVWNMILNHQCLDFNGTNRINNLVKFVSIIWEC